MRVSLEDGRWFSTKSAECYEESTYWDGRNHVSEATGGQWEHEKLYFTSSGKWILNHWSQWQGSRERYEVIEPVEAARWLSRCGYSLDAFEDEGLAAFEEEFQL